MKKIFVLIISVLIFVVLAMHANAAQDEIITVADTAVGFTAANITSAGSATKAVCTLETAAIRFYSTGSTPTATTGHLLNVGETVTITGVWPIKNFKAIRTGATSGILTCSYFFE